MWKKKVDTVLWNYVLKTSLKKANWIVDIDKYNYVFIQNRTPNREEEQNIMTQWCTAIFHVILPCYKFLIFTRGIKMQMSYNYDVTITKRHYIYGVIIIFWRHRYNDVMFWQNECKKCPLRMENGIN